MKVWLAATSLIAAVVLPSAGAATTLGCLPGVRPHVFARSQLEVSPSEAKRLEADLERHSMEIGLTYSSVGSYDPYRKPPVSGLTIVLQSRPSAATVIEVRTSSRNRFARVTVGNNCFAKREDWRPYWSAFNALLNHLGYRQ